MIANAERSKAAGEHMAVAGIAVAEQIVRCPLPAARFRELIGDPLGGRMRRNAKPQDLSPAMPMIKSPYINRDGQSAPRTGPERRCHPHDWEEMSSIPATKVGTFATCTSRIEITVVPELLAAGTE